MPQGNHLVRGRRVCVDDDFGQWLEMRPHLEESRILYSTFFVITIMSVFHEDISCRKINDVGIGSGKCGALEFSFSPC